MVVSARLREFFARGQIDAALLRYGEAFLGDWLCGGGALGGRDLAGVRGGKGEGGDVMVPAARQRLARAKAALGWHSKPEPHAEARAVNGVVVLDMSCGEVARDAGWSGPGTAMDALRSGLRRLQVVYGMAGDKAA